MGNGPVYFHQACIGLGQSASDLGQAPGHLGQQTINLSNPSLDRVNSRLQFGRDVAPGHGAYYRQSAVIVDEVKTKFRIVEPLGKVTCSQTELPAVAGAVGVTTWNRSCARGKERRIRGAWCQSGVESRV